MNLGIRGIIYMLIGVILALLFKAFESMNSIHETYLIIIQTIFPLCSFIFSITGIMFVVIYLSDKMREKEEKENE